MRRGGARRRGWLVLGGLLAVGMATAEEFRDVPADHWAREAIDYAVQVGVLEGFDGKFHGQKLINRYQMAVIVKRWMTASDFGYSGSDQVFFPEVPRTHWAWKSLQQGTATGLLTGYSMLGEPPTKEFHGERLLNRFQLAGIAFRFLTGVGYSAVPAPLPEDVPRGHPLVRPIREALGAGIFQEIDGGFRGERLVNRYQMAWATRALIEAGGGPRQPASSAPAAPVASKPVAPDPDCVTEEMAIELHDEASELLQQLRECKRQRALLEARIRELEVER